MQIITVIIIGISLSMDAFSLSLAYGTLNLNKLDIYKLSIIVGIYHFIMPQIGLKIGNKILEKISINPNIVVFIVLFIIGLQMILESFKEESRTINIKLKELLIFGLAVSIDSFSVGIGLSTICKNIILSSFIISLESFLFTYLGLYLGKKINEIIGKISTIVGGFSLMIIGLIYII